MPSEEEMHEEEQASLEFARYINTLGGNFDELCQRRHEEGQEEYGAFTFLENDIPRMMLEELADTVNYCRYQAVKMMMLQQALENQLAGTNLANEDQQITIGIQAFKGTKDVGWNGFKS